MNKKAYTKPAVAVIDVKLESALLGMSRDNGQNPDNNPYFEGEVETKGESNFWDEW